MKSSASESKPFQSRSKGEIPGRARQKERLSRSKLKQAFLIDSDAELFMYLSQCVRFGLWNVRRLNRAQVSHWHACVFGLVLEVRLSVILKDFMALLTLRFVFFYLYSPNLLMFYSRKTGLKITAGQQTMSGQNGLLTGQTFHSLVMLTGHAHSHSWINS